MLGYISVSQSFIADDGDKGNLSYGRYFNKLRLRGRKQVIYNTSKIVTVISITRRVA